MAKGWLYKGEEVSCLDQIPHGVVGFVYQITINATGQKYVGKKALSSTRTKKLTKKELAERTGPGRKPATKKVTSETDWLTYRGSSKEFLALVKDVPDDELTKEILCFCGSKKSLSYNEVKYQILLGVLEKSEYSNTNILGKFFPKDCATVTDELRN